MSYLNKDGADHSGFVEGVQASRAEKGFNGYTHKLWLYWEKCKVSGNVDFRTPNDALFELYDEDTRKELVQVCAEKIKQFLAEK